MFLGITNGTDLKLYIFAKCYGLYSLVVLLVALTSVLSHMPWKDKNVGLQLVEFHVRHWSICSSCFTGNVT